MLRKTVLQLSIAAAFTAASVPAHAGIPVIDATAVANLIQQISYWQQQISAMAQQIAAVRQTTSALTGGRGMETLLPATTADRNYLPSDYGQLTGLVDGSGGGTYSGLAAQVQAALAANAVLSQASVSRMSPQMQQVINGGRQAAAMLQTMTQSAYGGTSARFGALQQLVSAVGTTGDAKAAADLQARIAAEQTMLTNEQTKLQVLMQVAQADDIARQQRIREMAVQQSGRSSTLPQVRLNSPFN